MTEKRLRAGVEVGGTFTDLVGFDGDRIVVTKVRSTPHAPDEGAIEALRSSGLSIAAIDGLGHGSTVATNAVLERKGARLAFVTTAGFRDILFLQRHDRKSIYDLRYHKPEPLVARQDCYEVAERVAGDGSVITPLDEAAIRDTLIPRLRDGNYQAVAICLLNGYVNPDHENRLVEMIAAEIPDLLFTPSSGIVRQFREFERASTTTLSAYVQPVIQSYLERFERNLADLGFSGNLTVMQSNGGRLPAAAMGRNAITALFSGPAAGVVGATHQAGLSGRRNLITFDMGGTSTDVCLVEDGKPQLASETEIGGLPIQIPVLDIVTVGGGGGSIAWVDAGGMLRVGPQSAGADPGPACYGFGGTDPTVTDAQVILGALRPEAFLGGRMKIDPERAHEVMARLGERIGLGVEETAESVLKLVNANIVRAIQLVSTERGRDPRDYVLVPFGGGGPLHAAGIAEQLGIAEVCVPPNAGVISAYGLLAADHLKFLSRTRKMPLADGPTEGVATLRELEAELADDFDQMGLSRDDLIYSYTAELRFVGQAFEVPVDLPPERLDNLTEKELIDMFEEVHQRLFYHGIGANKPIEIVAFRVGATLPLKSVPPMTPLPQAGGDGHCYPLFEGGDWTDCQHVGSGAVEAGLSLKGPAVIEDSTTTILVPGGWTARVDNHSNIIMGKD